MNVQVRYLIALTYRTSQPLERVLGGPEWLNNERFDIIAKAEGDFPNGPEGPPPPQLYGMLERCWRSGSSWSYTRNERVDTYRLVLARSDGKLSTGLRPSSVDCEVAAASRGRGRTPIPPPQRGPAELRVT